MAVRRGFGATSRARLGAPVAVRRTFAATSRARQGARAAAFAAAPRVLTAFVVAASGFVSAAPARAVGPAVQCPQPITESLSAMGVAPVPQSNRSKPPWPQQRLDPARAWPLSTGAHVVVAVVDSGVDTGAVGLAAAGKVLPGVDELGRSSTADTDCVGHGTLVAGLIAAGPVPGSPFEGVAPDAVILPIRQSDALGDRNGNTALTKAVYDAVALHASVINISITETAQDPALRQAIAYALAENVVVVAAAGNDYTNGDAAEYPASYPGVLAVGAIDQNDGHASFSETGTPVSVVAPGVAITGPGAGVGELVTGAQGTSFAAPFVSGVVALVRAFRPELTAAQVVRRIEATADRLPGAAPDPRFGWGVVDPYAAVSGQVPGENDARTGAAAGAAPGFAAPLPVPAPVSPVGHRDRGRAEAVAAGALGVAVLIAVVARLVPGGAARRWRPGRWGVVR